MDAEMVKALKRLEGEWDKIVKSTKASSKHTQQKGAGNKLMEDGRYRTEAGSIITISENGKRSWVSFNWIDEGHACRDCEPNPYPTENTLTWTCKKIGRAHV